MLCASRLVKLKIISFTVFRVLVAGRGSSFSSSHRHRHRIFPLLPSIDNFIKLLNEHRHAGLEPLFLNDRGSITMKTSFSAKPDAIYTLFHVEG